MTWSLCPNFILCLGVFTLFSSTSKCCGSWSCWERLLLSWRPRQLSHQIRCWHWSGELSWDRGTHLLFRIKCDRVCVVTFDLSLQLHFSSALLQWFPALLHYPWQRVQGIHHQDSGSVSNPVLYPLMYLLCNHYFLFIVPCWCFFFFFFNLKPPLIGVGKFIYWFF